MSVKANKVAGWDDLNNPGDYYISKHVDNEIAYIHFYCPCGGCSRSYICGIPIKTGDKIDKAWQWDGNEDSPTLTPSIFRHVDIPDHGDVLGRKCEWHGFLTNGVFIQC